MKTVIKVCAVLALLLLGTQHALATQNAPCSSTAACRLGKLQLTASTQTTISTLYTVPTPTAPYPAGSGGNGATISAILCSTPLNVSVGGVINGYITPSGGQPLQFLQEDIVQQGNAVGPSSNLLIVYPNGANTFTPSLPTEGFGNQFLMLSPGDAVQISMAASPVYLTGSQVLNCFALVNLY